MPIYKFKGYGAEGREVSGTVEAEGPREATLKVKEQGVHPKSIEPAVAAVGDASFWSFRRKADPSRLPAITRQLSVLLRAGVPLVEALRALADESGGQYRTILVDVKEKVVAGAGLARALEDYPEIFPVFYRNMIAAAEETGRLDDVLARMADFLESRQRMTDKVRTAMIYPVIMFCVAGMVLVLLFTFVVPKIVGIFENTRTALPLATVLLIWISDVVRGYWWALLALAGGAVFAWKRALDTKREAIDRLLDLFAFY